MVFMECLSYEYEDIIISSFKSRSHHRDGTFGTFAVPRKTEKFCHRTAESIIRVLQY